MHTSTSRSRLAEAAGAVMCALVAVIAAGGAAHAETDVRGIVRAVDQAMISTDLQTRVARIAFQEGERFNKGDIIVEFDCRKPRADLAAAEAQLLEMTLTLEKYKLLQKAQAAGKSDLEVSDARAQKAAAEADGLRARIDQCQVKAPYDGRVLELTVREMEAPQPGKPFIGIVSEGALEVDLIVPSDWVQWVRPGDAFTFEVDETGTKHAARVKRTGAAVDAISQTIKIVGGLDPDAKGVLPGMSGRAHFVRAGG